MDFMDGIRSGKTFCQSGLDLSISPAMMQKPPWEMTATEIERAVREAELRMWRRANPNPIVEPVQIKRAKYLDCLLAGEESTGDILKEMGEKEDTMRTLSTEKIKRITIECEDGTTYEGVINRIEGCPFDYKTMTVEAKIGAPVGKYGIKKVIFNNPATIVYWTDGTQTVVCCQDNIEEIVKEITKIIDGEEVTVKKKVRKPKKTDAFNPEIGLAMAIAKKHFGNKGNYNDVFKNFIGEE